MNRLKPSTTKFGGGSAEDKAPAYSTGFASTADLQFGGKEMAPDIRENLPQNIFRRSMAKIRNSAVML